MVSNFYKLKYFPLTENCFLWPSWNGCLPEKGREGEKERERRRERERERERDMSTIY